VSHLRQNSTGGLIWSIQQTKMWVSELAPATPGWRAVYEGWGDEGLRALDVVVWALANWDDGNHDVLGMVAPPGMTPISAELLPGFMGFISASQEPEDLLALLEEDE
jgi:hypothetical protein